MLLGKPRKSRLAGLGYELKSVGPISSHCQYPEPWESREMAGGNREHTPPTDVTYCTHFEEEQLFVFVKVQCCVYVSRDVGQGFREAAVELEVGVSPHCVPFKKPWGVKDKRPREILPHCKKLCKKCFIYLLKNRTFQSAGSAQQR